MLKPNSAGNSANMQLLWNTKVTGELERLPGRHNKHTAVFTAVITAVLQCCVWPEWPCVVSCFLQGHDTTSVTDMRVMAHTKYENVVGNNFLNLFDTNYHCEIYS